MFLFAVIKELISCHDWMKLYDKSCIIQMRLHSILIGFCLCCCSLFAQPNYDFSRLQMERLGRGVVAVRNSENEVVVSWRYLASDSEEIAFDVLRNGRKVNKEPIKDCTFFVDRNSSDEKALYEVHPVLPEGVHAVNGIYELPANAPCGYLEIPLQKPAGGISPDGRRFEYTPNDASIGDVDGDGEYEIILKWEPTNAHDNSHDGYTGNTLFEAYRLNGQRLWQIDLGHNIRSGAHYVPFLVYDFDGDGRAELAVRTSDGTVDGKGKIIGDAKADYRGKGGPEDPRSLGRILTGREFLTVFSGLTGEELCSVPYVPSRGNPSDWGDSRANRSDRFLAAVAYLDGCKPSIVMCRGYYTRTVLAAFDWDGKKLKKRWVFDSNRYPEYAGQGNHNLRVGDVDGDGCDEIVYGSCTIDHNGNGLYSTGMGHGDAMHLTCFDPSEKKLQVWDCHENKRDGSSFRDAATGKVLWQVKSSMDVGRCMAADIDPTSSGVEMWSLASGGIRSVKGKVLCKRPRRLSCNMAVWWDGDLLRELLDGVTVSKYDWQKRECVPLITFEGCQSNNWTKRNPCLQADILGDWREEVLLRTKDNNALRLYVSPIPTSYRFHSFLNDPVYRISIATQNVGYNQPTQPGFYFGPDLKGYFRGMYLSGGN